MSDKRPYFSVITVVFNDKNGIRTTIESTLNQSCKDFEYIIIDGGSTDGTVAVIREYEPELTVFVSEPDRGIYNAMNKGILRSTGEYLIFMNSGDRFYSPCTLSNIEKSLYEADNPDLLLGSTRYEHQFFSKIKKAKLTYLEMPCGHQSTVTQRRLFNEYGTYEEKYQIAADYEFWMRSTYKRKTNRYIVCYCIAVQKMDGISNTRVFKSMYERFRIIQEYGSLKLLLLGTIRIVSSLLIIFARKLFRKTHER